MSDITSIKKIGDNSPIYGIEFEYQMPKSLADTLIVLEGKKVTNKQKFLVDYVNREFGLKGYCKKVVVI